MGEASFILGFAQWLLLALLAHGRSFIRFKEGGSKLKLEIQTPIVPLILLFHCVSTQFPATECFLPAPVLVQKQVPALTQKSSGSLPWLKLL